MDTAAHVARVAGNAKIKLNHGAAARQRRNPWSQYEGSISVTGKAACGVLGMPLSITFADLVLTKTVVGTSTEKSQVQRKVNVKAWILRVRVDMYSIDEPFLPCRRTEIQSKASNSENIEEAMTNRMVSTVNTSVRERMSEKSKEKLVPSCEASDFTVFCKCIAPVIAWTQTARQVAASPIVIIRRGSRSQRHGKG